MYKQMSSGQEEDKLRSFCERMLEQTVVSCGLEHGEFFIEFEDGTEATFWSEDNDLQMRMFLPNNTLN